MQRSNFMTDGELARAFAAEGSRPAFDELVRRHGGIVYRTCRRVLGDHHDAEDATQAVFGALMEQAARLTHHRSLAGWLYGAAWNVARRQLRARATRLRYERRLAPAVEATPGTSVDREELGELYRAIYMLPPDYVDAIVLHHLEGMTIAQVAELTGTSVGTAASRVSRGRAMIRERLARRGVVFTTAALSAAFASEAAVATPTVQVPTGLVASAAVTAPAASAACVAGAASAGGTAIASAWSTKWAVAACLAASVGTGATFMRGDKTAAVKPAPQPRFVVASVTTTAGHTAAGSDDVEDAPLDSLFEGWSSPGTGGTSIVPEPGSFGVIAAVALAALARRRR